MNFKKELTNNLKKQLKKEINLTIPPKPEFGDLSLPCFTLDNPLKIQKKLKLPKFIKKVEITGKYLNFFLDNDYLAKTTLTRILKEKEKYGHSKVYKEKIVIESPGPNTNKPLHLGHLRNMVLGISITNLQKATGNKVIPVDIVNDRGIHIAKSVLAYQKFGKNKKPDKKPDHFVGDFYILFAKKLRTNPNLEEEAKEIIRKYESGEKETINLFKKMNKWAMLGINQTYKRVGVKIKKTYLESQHYEKGKEIILNGFKKNTFKKDHEGNIIINLKEEGLGEKVLLRSDQTSVYITQDLSLALKRYQDYKMDKMIYLVGSEQIYHFKVLFKIMGLLGYKFAKNYFHLTHGMIYLPEGKMKSREGEVVDADTLLDEMHSLARKEIIKRNPKLNKKELEKRAEYIAQAAVKFFLLKHDITKDFVFYPEKSLSFEGDTGPYIQYTYARGNSILKKAKIFKTEYKFSEDDEIKLIKLLSEFPEIICDAATKYRPNLLAQHLLDISHTFNEFYQKCPILKAKKGVKESRLTLVKATNQVLKNGLGMLGINILNEM